MREDGAWINSGENDNAILQTLTRTPGSLGVFGYSFLEQNMDTVKAETIDGVAPDRRRPSPTAPIRWPAASTSM